MADNWTYVVRWQSDGDESNWVLERKEGNLIGWSAIMNYIDERGYRIISAIAQKSVARYDLYHPMGPGLPARGESLRSLDVDVYRLFVVRD